MKSIIFGTRNSRPKRKRFSLIELLVVIAVIAILMGILLPVVGSIRQRGKIAKAQAEISSIVNAIKSYEATYGLLPWGGGADVKWNNWTDEDDEYDTLMQILTKVDMASGDATNMSDQGNSRNVTFLDSPSSFANDGFLDPWRNRYAITMDLDYTNKIDFNEDGDEDDISSGDDLAGTVFAYSFGPDGKDNNGDGDDITSWK